MNKNLKNFMDLEVRVPEGQTARASVLVDAALVRIGGLVAELLHGVLLLFLGLLVSGLRRKLLNGVPGGGAVGRGAAVAGFLGIADRLLDARGKFLRKPRPGSAAGRGRGSTVWGDGAPRLGGTREVGEGGQRNRNKRAGHDTGKARERGGER